jgi:hypothetical protein
LSSFFAEEQIRPISDHPGIGLFSFMQFSNALGKIWIRWTIPGFVGFMGIRWIIARQSKTGLLLYKMYPRNWTL